jgi:hypothetical protein
MLLLTMGEGTRVENASLANPALYLTCSLTATDESPILFYCPVNQKIEER